MASRTGGGVGTNQHAIKGRSKTTDPAGKARAGALTDDTNPAWEPPAALRDWTTFDGDTQVDVGTRIRQLGWESAHPVRISGDQTYDDISYFTPTLEVIVRDDLHISDVAKAAYNAWVLDTGGTELADDPNLTPAEFAMDDVIDVLQGVHREHLEAAGVIIINRPDAGPDVFDEVHIDEVGVGEWDRS